MRDFLLTLYSYCILYISHLIHIPDDEIPLIGLKSDNAHFAGLVLARGGSKGIKLKNLSRINNVTLLTRTLNTMQKFGRFDSIWVSTDNEKIAEEAKLSPNVSVHHRAAYTATDTATSLIAVQEFLGQHPEVDMVALVQCTSPFLRPEYLAKAYDAMMSGYHSIFSVTRQFKLRWKLTEENKLIPDNFKAHSRPRRQDWRGEIIENGMFYMTYATIAMEFNVLQGGRIGVVDIPPSESLEIDNINDLLLAEIIDLRRS
uniref:N-acylneuraminate cytidylyltransferase n=3 Tax=Lygus hesperus TaxID=30085 RepID=A0A146KMH0_LYGHE